ncbi:MAG: hypothetical protein R2771_11780 [Saprospiraceae bacterium]
MVYLSVSCLFFAYQKNQLHKESKSIINSQIAKEDIIILKFHVNETNKYLQWKRENEFKYEGVMYDLISEEIRNDSVFYYCWADIDETKLNHSFNEFIDVVFGNNQQSVHYKYLVKLFKTSFFINSYNCELALDCEKNNRGFRYYFLYKSPSGNPLSPPPELV